MTIKTDINDAHIELLAKLSTYSHPVTAFDIGSGSSSALKVGKMLDNLRKRGLVDKIPNEFPKAKANRWMISTLGRELLNPRLHPQNVTVSPSNSNIPPTTPDHFIFVVTEEKLNSMIRSRDGLGLVIKDESSDRSQLLKTIDDQIRLIAELEEKIEKYENASNDLRRILKSHF